MPRPLDRFSKAVPSDTPFLQEEKGGSEGHASKGVVVYLRLPNLA